MNKKSKENLIWVWWIQFFGTIITGFVLYPFIQSGYITENPLLISLGLFNLLIFTIIGLITN